MTSDADSLSAERSLDGRCSKNSAHCSHRIRSYVDTGLWLPRSGTIPTGVILWAGRSFAEFLVQHAAADFRPHLHIRVHSFPRSVRGLPDGKSHHWTTTHRELKQERHGVFQPTLGAAQCHGIRLAFTPPLNLVHATLC